MDELSGQEITRVYTHYNNIVIAAGDKAFFISPEELIKILNEFEFKTETKRTRTWLHVDIDDWRIEKFNEPRTF